MRILALLAIIIALTSTAFSQSAATEVVTLRLSLASAQTEFHIGETIPLQLAFSSSAKDRYQINMAQYDRIGRMNYEEFILTPADGAVNPLPTLTGSLGGLTNHKFLTTEPWVLRISINEWIRFTEPGEYRLVLLSHRVSVRETTAIYGTSPITVRSNEIALKIVPANPAWQKQVLEVGAIATAREWLADKSKLERISGMTAVRRIHDQRIDRYLAYWNSELLKIEINPSRFGFHAHVAQYELQSMKEVKAKLAQFPAGTKFKIFGTESDNQSFVELKRFLTEHGMAVVE